MGQGRAGSAGGLNASESRLAALPGLFMTLGTPGICAQAPDGGCRIGDSQTGKGRRQLMAGLTGKKPAAAPGSPGETFLRKRSAVLAAGERSAVVRGEEDPR